jgi:hypothetical protein
MSDHDKEKMDEVLRRMLNTPPKPHDSKDDPKPTQADDKEDDKRPA